MKDQGELMVRVMGSLLSCIIVADIILIAIAPDGTTATILSVLFGIR